MAWKLCSKEDVMALYPVLEGELKDQWSNFAESLIQQYMGQKYLGISQIITNEYYNGDGTFVLRLKNTPIISVQSILVGNTTETTGGLLELSSSDYVIFPTYIALIGQVFPAGELNIQVSYTSGQLVADVPYNVNFCAASMIIAMLQHRRKLGSDSSIKWSDVEQKGGEKSQVTQRGLISQLNKIMIETLRRPAVRAKV